MTWQSQKDNNANQIWSDFNSYFNTILSAQDNFKLSTIWAQNINSIAANTNISFQLYVRCGKIKILFF